MSQKTHDSLDAAITAHMQDINGDQAALITHWVVVVATVDSNGDPRIMNDFRDEQMPTWQIKGLLSDAIEKVIDAEGETDD